MRPEIDRLLDYREFPLLYVDDEPENLRIFELTFQREFSVLTASSGEEALAILNEQPIAMILSDQNMPGMLGTELLQRSGELDSKVIRILVTAYGDADTLSSAINNGSIYRYVPKPWSPEDMNMTIRRGIEAYALDREREQLLRELTLLNQVSRSICQELDLSSLLNLLVDTITHEFEYDAASILLMDDNGRRLKWGSMGREENCVSREVGNIRIDKQSCPAFFRALDECKVQQFSFGDSSECDAPIQKWLVEISADDLLVIPLAGGNGVLGAFAVDNRRGGGRFTWEDRTLLEGLANQAVIAIENANLVEDLRRSREQVQRFDRLGTLGTLAAGLAHEINNPLVSIHTFLSMAPAKRFEDDSEFWNDYHSIAAGEVERIRRLVETMRQLGRDNPSETPKQPVELDDVCNHVVLLLSQEANRAGVSIEWKHDGGTVKVMGVRDHLHQLCMNLVLNAIHATPKGGRISIGLELDDLLPGVRIEISDSGSGIADENLERIFDPFFTTKGPDQGSGLGLMVCHRIVEDHGGTIEVRSRAGEGTVFVVRLPSIG